MSSQFRGIAAAVIGAVATLAMGQASAQMYSNSGYAGNNGYGYGNSGYGNSRTVRCESINSRRAFCRMDTRGGVRITHQLSQRACVQGRNWSYTSQGIWVSNGCRAEFAISSRNGYRNGNPYARNGYNSNGYNSNGYNSNYGYQNNDYRGSNNGYRNGDSGHTHFMDSSGRIIHCQSTADGRNYCGDSHTRYTMSGNRDPDCIEGQSWGRDGRGTWVSGDCDADFSTDENDDENGDQFDDHDHDHHH